MSSKAAPSAPRPGSTWASVGCCSPPASIRGALGTVPNFGVMAAKALEVGKLDGFWANGMGAEVAVRGGYGTVVADVRRGDDPKQCFNFTAPTIATTEAL